MRPTPQFIAALAVIAAVIFAEPSRSLAQGAEYVPAVSSDIRALFARIQYPQEEQQCATSSQRS